MEAAYVIGLILFIVHIVAFIVGGANAVVMPVLGPRLAAAGPEVRGSLMPVAEHLSRMGKYAMATLLVSGVLVLWLKWNWTVPNLWFWVKMAGVAAMLVFIGLNEVNTKKARGGDAGAGKRAAQFGQMTAIAFLVVVVAAVFAFN
jgi:hypothetical protein